MDGAAGQRSDGRVERLLELSERLRRQCVAARDEDAARRELRATVVRLSDEAVGRARAALARIGKAGPDSGP